MKKRCNNRTVLKKQKTISILMIKFWMIRRSTIWSNIGMQIGNCNSIIRSVFKFNSNNSDLTGCQRWAAVRWNRKLINKKRFLKIVGCPWCLWGCQGRVRKKKVFRIESLIIWWLLMRFNSSRIKSVRKVGSRYTIK